MSLSNPSVSSSQKGKGMTDAGIYCSFSSETFLQSHLFSGVLWSQIVWLIWPGGIISF